MKPLIINVKSPNVRIFTGKVRIISRGLTKAFKRPSTRAATMAVSQLLMLIPETIWTTRSRLTVLINHLSRKRCMDIFLIPASIVYTVSNRKLRMSDYWLLDKYTLFSPGFLSLFHVCSSDQWDVVFCQEIICIPA